MRNRGHHGLSAEGICPACLLKLGLPGDQSDEAPTVTAPGEAPSPARRVDDRLTPGQTFGRYRVERLLGKGGMGEVYEAEELDSGRRVALKLLTHGLDEVNRDRFLREGRLAASVNHPNTVYIFGTDEIEGIPVIAMELAAGGTLKDKVKAEGPLPPAKAVDVILQVIAGLEAAADAGVLHRDIKPSNCFVDRDGTVKVGDFGLSISTLSRTDTQTQLTTTGSVLGTPAFASPEQLRGDELDVRSDIYAVGATLYYLLTGRAPFEEANVLKLATMVAQEPPQALRRLRPTTPRGLAALTSRCLAKQPTARVPSYERLLMELEPFSSAARTPARMSTRVIAFLLDYLVAFFVPLGAGLALRASGGSPVLPTVLLAGAFILNFWFAEGWWGASIGKAVLGLRVRLNNEAPGLGRGLLRSVVFWVLFLAPGPLSQQVFWPLVAPLVGMLILFSTARRHNGFAGLHDLASGTRVVARPLPRGRPVRTESGVGSDASGHHVGPYLVKKNGGKGVVLAFDPRLRRQVWLRLLARGTPAVSPQRRDLARPTRLRWLAGRRGADEDWDAYEGVDGSPLLARLTQPQPWADVRDWLHDVAVELRAGLADGSLADLALDRVWIGVDGRARILDWPPPGPDEVRDPEPVLAGSQVDAQSALRFLRRVASSALGGRPSTPDDLCDLSLLSRLPLLASEFLRKLNTGAFGTLQGVVDALPPLLRRPVALSPWKRAAHLSLCIAPAMLFTASSMMVLRSVSFGGDAPATMNTQITSMQLALTFLLPTALVGLVTASAFKGGLLFRGLDLAIVDAAGREVTRLRALVRALVAWSPVLIAFATLLFRRDLGVELELGVLEVAVPSLAVMAIGAVWAGLNPNRGLQDRIAGTYLVPR